MKRYTEEELPKIWAQQKEEDEKAFHGVESPWLFNLSSVSVYCSPAFHLVFAGVFSHRFSINCISIWPPDWHVGVTRKKNHLSRWCCFEFSWANNGLKTFEFFDLLRKLMGVVLEVIDSFTFILQAQFELVHLSKHERDDPPSWRHATAGPTSWSPKAWWPLLSFRNQR